MDFNEFKHGVLVHFRLDLNSYKENQLKRRIDGLLSRQKLNNYAELFQSMIGNRQAYEAFLDHLTINVSEFFRDPLRWQELEKNILPTLIRSRGTIKIWSAACSFGAEPYSLAILLDELMPGGVYRLDATDLDKTILETARVGKYSPDAVKNVSKERLARHFTVDGGSYLISERIKSKVSFRRHDLLTEEYQSGYDLIVCRNVTIYFTREAQDKINKNFSRSLQPGGVLFIGGSEMIFNYQELGLEKILPCFYRKKQ
ncbi:MAG: protein-glutamate O-methyltransferase CheR [Peptococcaceae bacterium]|nr:protein-glutamate O-methyltransferase CheR [Peptococcaceae bacterium]